MQMVKPSSRLSPIMKISTNKQEFQVLNDIESSVESPCVRNCCLSDDDVCLGCFRSLAEITQWNEANNHERNCILQNARQRKEASNFK
jgi:hypothetical protein